MSGIFQKVFGILVGLGGVGLLSTALASDGVRPWVAAPEVIRQGGTPGEISGVVFHDQNGDGHYQAGEPGIAGVLVTNGLAVVATDAVGRYTLPVRDDMNLSVVQPSRWAVPTDAHRVPQFSYAHKPLGSATKLRYGGLPPTGEAPATINFPLQPAAEPTGTFLAAIIGDTQAYSHREVSYLRDSTLRDLTQLPEGRPDLLLYVGDVAGDDLNLLPRIFAVGSSVGAPQFAVVGNHDIDLDADRYADSADTWRRLVGPAYYAFEHQQALFIVLNNVYFPSTGERSNSYRGYVDPVQMAWLSNLLELVPTDRLIVIAHHIPFLSFVDADSAQHQTENLAAIHQLLAGRPAVSLSGHTHTIENHAPGQVFAGWTAHTGITELPFRHLIVGAASGSWYQGDLDHHGVPMSLQRLGAPKGFLLLEVNGTDYRETYRGAGIDPRTTMWVGLNTPPFRHWFNTLQEWRKTPARERSPIPPFSINDLPDTRILTPEDLASGVFLTANVWAGSSETTVVALLPGRDPLALTRTQEGRGEAPRIGAAWADPFASQRQLNVARFALQSTSGIARNQGIELFRGSRTGPAAPQPMGAVADRNMHLWRVQLPSDLPTGVYPVRIEATDRHGRTSTETLLFEVAPTRPAPHFDLETWQRQPTK